MPTLKEQGIDVELVNWRAVFAPPGIKDEDLAREAEAIELDGMDAEESRARIREAVERRYTAPANPN